MKKNSSSSRSSVTCITSRPKIVIDKRILTDADGAFVRSKLVQKKKSRYNVSCLILFCT